MKRRWVPEDSMVLVVLHFALQSRRLSKWTCSVNPDRQSTWNRTKHRSSRLVPGIIYPITIFEGPNFIAEMVYRHLQRWTWAEHNHPANYPEPTSKKWAWLTPASFPTAVVILSKKMQHSINKLDSETISSFTRVHWDLHRRNSESKHLNSVHRSKRVPESTYGCIVDNKQYVAR